ncbi:MAG: DUF99 family protein [Polyangiaceae bacterium]
MARRLSNVVGFDDAPFPRHAREVRLIGTVCARTRLDGVLSSVVTRDGDDATDRMIELVRGSHFDGHIQAVLLQGIAVAGFNVVDIHRLSESLERPVLVVARRAPNLEAIRQALERTGEGWDAKWRLIEAAGPMERLALPPRLLASEVWVQRAGLDLVEALDLCLVTNLHGALPEPLRLAHLIAGGVTTGESRGRA